jgi:aspartate/methionine/tyrosine aminotransferase
MVLVDETYRESVYGSASVPESVASLSSRVVTCSSLSKAHGAPGLRVGWLTTTDEVLYERLRELKFNTAIASSTIDEFLAAEVLRRRAEILQPRAVRLRAALDELLAWVADHPVEIVTPDGGALCCLRLPADRFDDGAVADFYKRLEDLETRVAPGSWFGDTDRVFRLGFGHLPPDVFTAALDRLATALTLPDSSR